MTLGRAQNLLDAGQYDKAAEVLGAADPEDVRDPRRTVVLARILEARGDLPQAVELLNRLRTARPEYAPGHLFYAIFAGDAGQLESSAAALDRVLELQSANDVARSYRALAYLKQGEDAAALENFRRYGFSDNRMFRVRLTEWMEQQWLDHDRFFGQRSLELPVNMGPTQLQDGDDSASAVPAPDAGSGASPGIGWFRRSLLERRAGQLYPARRYREMVEVLAPLAGEAHPDEGVLFTSAFGAEMLHDYDLALRYINRLPQDTEQWPDALLALRGRILVRQRRFREAAADLNRVEVIGPEDYGANYYFGVLCLAHGQRAQARRLFFRAHTQYLIDTLETQWWQIEQALLGGQGKI